jgi:hypothetical protein
MEDRFHEMLSNPLFDNVNYRVKEKWVTYSMIPYSEEWSKFARVLDKRMKEQTGEGIFTRKYNKKLLAEIQEIADNITPEDVKYANERFRTWID